MNVENDSGKPRGHGVHGWLAMLACCIPMIVIFLLIFLKVI